MTAAEFASFLGWCTLLNFGLLIVSTIALVTLGKAVAKIHAHLFELDSSEVRSAYFTYLANFKTLVIIFNFVPYIALRIMGW